MANNGSFFHMVFDSFPANIAIFNETGTIVQVNEAWRKYACENGAYDQTKCCEGANYLEVTRRAINDGTRGAAAAYHGLFQVLNGSESLFTLDYESHTTTRNRWFALTAILIPGQKNVMVSHTDITNRVESIRLGDEYVAMVAHDLKSPITAITAMAQLTLRHYDKKDKVLQRLLNIQHLCVRMDKMISELSEASYLNSGMFRLAEEKVALQSLLEKTLEMYHEAAQSRIRMVLPQEPLIVCADYGRLLRVMQNLLSNALKFSPEDKTITVSLKIKDAQAEIEVRDQGIGIASVDLPHIFDRYYRVKTIKRKEGFGLGLHISRMIVQSHHGTIDVESLVGKGSTFRVTLPLMRKSE